MSRRRNRALALGLVGVGAGVAAAAAYNNARRHRSGALDMSELELADDITPVEVVVDDGVTIHGVEAGSGRPIVLLHGVTLSVATWPYQLAALSKQYRVIALDARGHGASKCDQLGWGMERMADDVHQVIETLDLHDAIVVGHSMGGMMTQEMCVMFPEMARERIAGVVLLSTAAAPSEGVPGFHRMNRMVKPGMITRGESVMPRGEIGYALARLALGAKADPRFVMHTRNMTAALSPATIDSLLPNVVGFDVRPRLKDFPIPALVITGSRDLLTPPRVGKTIARLIPGAEMKILPGAGHMLMMERAEWLNEQIDEFARAHEHARAD